MAVSPGGSFEVLSWSPPPAQPGCKGVPRAVPCPATALHVCALLLFVACHAMSCVAGTARWRALPGLGLRRRIIAVPSAPQRWRYGATVHNWAVLLAIVGQQLITGQPGFVFYDLQADDGQ